jgi:hypothetical protein
VAQANGKIPATKTHTSELDSKSVVARAFSAVVVVFVCVVVDVKDDNDIIGDVDVDGGVVLVVVGVGVVVGVLVFPRQLLDETE